MNEIMFLLRRKISSKSPQTVELTMLLIGSFVNNCGSRFHAALNDEKVTREIANAVRLYSKKPGIENKRVTDTSLDLVQSWGEAFLPRRKEFYHIVDLYFTLRKENLPFKAQQFDPTRVPIFDSAGGSTHSGASEDTDAILAAAMQSSMQREEDENQRLRRPDPTPSHVPYSDDRRYESNAVRKLFVIRRESDDHLTVWNFCVTAPRVEGRAAGTDKPRRRSAVAEILHGHTQGPHPGHHAPAGLPPRRGGSRGSGAAAVVPG
jgi:hypothetical protein